MLAHLFGGGQTSLLYRKLVLEEKKAVAVGRLLHGLGARRDALLSLRACRRPASRLPDLDAAVDRVLQSFIVEGVETKALERAKTRLVADAIYAQDSQATLARWYGAALATGETIRDVLEWPARIEAVSAEETLAAARKWLERRRAVTGFLLPADEEAA